MDGLREHPNKGEDLQDNHMPPARTLQGELKGSLSLLRRMAI